MLTKWLVCGIILSMGTIEGSENLGERLDVIRGLPIGLDDRVFMSLVCLGMIPAWEIFLEEGEISDNELEAKLIDAGFETRKVEFNEMRRGGRRVLGEICYSNSIESVDKLFKLGGLEESSSVAGQLGELYGFPPTSVAGYLANQKSDFTSRRPPAEFENEDFMFLAQFCLSKDHWREELETPKKWAEALAQYVPDLWQDFVAERRSLKADNWGER